MKVFYDKAVMHNPLEVLRRAGYSAFTDPNTGIQSFELRPTSAAYPRFHLYVAEKNGEVSFNLHLDQKKPSYGDSHMHSGEYEGKTVENEMRRIDGWVRASEIEAVGSEPSKSNEQASGKPWWKIW